MLSVLIIDDSLTMRKMLESMFKEMDVKVVGVAKDGEEGIAKYDQFKPSFVTMDVNMPGISGLVALKTIRDKHSDANIFMLTSRGDNQTVKDAIKYGAKGYILKPLNKKKIEEGIISIFPNNFNTDNETEVKSETQGIQNYETSIKDSLTDLYTVQYMHNTIQHLIEMHDRNEDFAIGLLIVNINNLDDITQKVGGVQRDIILTQVADEIKDSTRGTDFPIRLASNEFAIFIMGSAINHMELVAKKLKDNIEKEILTKLEISVGMAIHNQKEKLIAFIERTDKAVVEAKKEESKILMTK